MRKNSQILAPLYEVVSVVVVVKVHRCSRSCSKKVQEGTRGNYTWGWEWECTDGTGVKGFCSGLVVVSPLDGGQLKRIPQRDCYPLSERLNSIVMRNRS